MTKISDEEVQACVRRAEEEYEMLKDRVHDLYDENERLKKKMNTMAYSIVYLKKDELGWIGKVFDKDLISIDDLISKLEDMQGEIDRLEEKYEDLEQNIEDNYRPIDPASQYGVSESWFH